MPASSQPCSTPPGAASSRGPAHSKPTHGLARASTHENALRGWKHVQELHTLNPGNCLKGPVRPMLMGCLVQVSIACSFCHDLLLVLSEADSCQTSFNIASSVSITVDGAKRLPFSREVLQRCFNWSELVWEIYLRFSRRCPGASPSKLRSGGAAWTAASSEGLAKELR